MILPLPPPAVAQVEPAPAPNAVDTCLQRVRDRNLFDPHRGLRSKLGGPGGVQLAAPPVLVGTLMAGAQSTALLRWSSETAALSMAVASEMRGFRLLKVEAARAELVRLPAGDPFWIELETAAESKPDNVGELKALLKPLPIPAKSAAGQMP